MNSKQLEEEALLLTKLTQLEREIYGKFLRGLKWMQIALLVGAHPKQMFRHKVRILAKLHLANEVELVTFAVRHGILSEYFPHDVD